jgi:hypothetical protein
MFPELNNFVTVRWRHRGSRMAYPDARNRAGAGPLIHSLPLGGFELAHAGPLYSPMR